MRGVRFGHLHALDRIRSFVPFMKLLTLGSVVSFAVLGLVACDQGAGTAGGDAAPATAPEAAGADAAAPAAAPAGDAEAPAAMGDAEVAKVEQTPQQACNNLIEAAKAKDDAKFLANATDVTAQAMADAASKEMMFGMMATATCGEGVVEGEKATVPVTAGADKRDVPFVKIGDAWKFDAAEYMNKYPPAPAKGKKAKKAKGAKGKKG